MIAGFEGSFSHSQNGMTRADMLATKLVAQRLDEVIIFRSTGPWAKRWLERGYPSKNFHVKGKSSDWGPHAGLRPQPELCHHDHRSPWRPKSKDLRLSFLTSAQAVSRSGRNCGRSIFRVVGKPPETRPTSQAMRLSDKDLQKSWFFQKPSPFGRFFRSLR